MRMKLVSSHLLSSFAVLAINLIYAMPAKAQVIRDVAQHPIESPSITRMVKGGIIQLVGVGTFAPDQVMNRGDFSTSVARSFRINLATVPIIAIAPYAARQAFCPGCQLTTNNQPKAVMSRAEAIVTTVRALGATGHVTSLSSSEIEAVLQPLADAKELSPLLAPFFAIAIKNQLILLDSPVGPSLAGVGPIKGASLNPHAQLTRAYAAVLMDHAAQTANAKVAPPLHVLPPARKVMP